MLSLYICMLMFLDSPFTFGISCFGLKRFLLTSLSEIKEYRKKIKKIVGHLVFDNLLVEQIKNHHNINCIFSWWELRMIFGLVCLNKRSNLYRLAAWILLCLLILFFLWFSRMMMGFVYLFFVYYVYWSWFLSFTKKVCWLENYSFILAFPAYFAWSSIGNFVASGLPSVLWSSSSTFQKLIDVELLRFVLLEEKLEVHLITVP